MLALASTASCRRCGQGFYQRSTLHNLCSPRCAVAEAKAKESAEKDDRKRTKARLAELQPRSHWVKQAQVAFNRFIRLRDADLPCISCQRMHQGQWHAGHYLTRGARPELAFDEDNCHKQCQPCNEHLSGNLVLYRVGLLARIGAERVARLEGPHPTLKLSIAALKELRRVYVAKAKTLQLEAA